MRDLLAFDKLNKAKAPQPLVSVQTLKMSLSLIESEKREEEDTVGELSACKTFPEGRAIFFNNILWCSPGGSLTSVKCEKGYEIMPAFHCKYFLYTMAQNREGGDLDKM